jgi:hypothetical protein
MLLLFEFSKSLRSSSNPLAGDSDREKLFVSWHSSLEDLQSCLKVSIQSHLYR